MHFAVGLPDWNSLESVRYAHSRLEGGALIAFALLVLFEVWAHLLEDEDKVRARWFEKIGLCFFAIAVLAEIVAYPYGERNDRLSADMIGSLSATTTQAEAKARKALTDSGTAITKAGEALGKSKEATDAAGKVQREVGAVAKQAVDLRLRIEAASKKLDDLDEDIRIQGPRSKLLIDGEKTFVEALKAFKGQKVIMVTCAPRQSPVQTDEEYEFELTLLNRLVEPRPGSAPGAGWDVRTGGPYGCKASGWDRGVWVMYSAPALKAAAEALGSALNKLKINADTIPMTGPASEYARQKRKPDDLAALFEVVASDPTAIYILTGEHTRAFNPWPKP